MFLMYRNFNVATKMHKGHKKIFYLIVFCLCIFMANFCC